MDGTLRPRALRTEEWEGLVDWLDDGLRRGLRGRLQGEYPISLRREHASRHKVVGDGEGFLAHAMFHRITARVDGSALPIGLISLVYTEPTARGRGLASRCVEACVEALEEEGAALALLWSDRPSFYERLGFHAIGKERLFALERGLVQAEAAADPARFEVEAWRPEDLRELEAMYGARSIRADREPGALGMLLAGPGVEAMVASDERGPRGYAVLGRGDDFPGIVHEWGGSGGAVLACLARFAATREMLGMLAGPRDEGPLPRLLAAGASWHESHFALVRLLDPEALFRAATHGAAGLDDIQVRRAGASTRMVRWDGARGWTELSEPEFLRLVLGGPAGGGTQAIAQVCGDAQRKTLAALWPWPLYLWGFDSI